MEPLNLTPFKGLPHLLMFSFKNRTINLCHDKPFKKGDKILLHGRELVVESILEKRKAKGNWSPLKKVPDFYILSFNYK